MSCRGNYSRDHFKLNPTNSTHEHETYFSGGAGVADPPADRDRGHQTREHHAGTSNQGTSRWDLKPGNITLVDDTMNVKIIDFGLTCHVSQASVGSPGGSTWYK